RMLAAVGNHVTGLHRVAIGTLALPAQLAPGAFAVLEPYQLGP
ncbi:MAG: 16S rRNA pseudouridine(516) synthase, partial [Myxococcaceae bacterium]|nr:16S rRNA pseudouridine(516) synthase [Myxococcaceae bacterium]